MNSLEFIEKQIEQEQGIIKTYEECFKIDKTEFDKQITRGYIQIHQKNINQLQQIKAELEAWEVVKDKNVKIGTVRTSPNYEVFNSLFNSDTIEKNRITEIEFDIIQKALEVKE